MSDGGARSAESAATSPVLAIGLDSSAWPLIEGWARGGFLPNLKRLYERGAHGRLNSPVDWLAGTPWPSFYTGSYPPDHGFLFHLQWRAETMRHERPGPEWLPMSPFYRRFGDHGKRVIAIDVPIAYAPEPMDGIEITSWSTHDKVGPTTSYPRDVLDWVNREIGKEPIKIEEGGLQKVGSLLNLRDDLIDSARKQAALCEALMAREHWDFFIIGIGAAHRGGHKLWDRSSALPMAPDEGSEYDHALRDVYVACDQAIGRILKAAGPDVTVLCFALHGMADNISRFDLVPPMLDLVLEDLGFASRAPKHGSPLHGLRAAVPVEWRNAVKARLPASVQDTLSKYWRGVDNRDWSKTPAFALMGDLQALVQINLKGREAKGIVEPGREYENLCDRITEGLMSFEDADTGEAIVARIGRGDKLYPEARYDVGLPDLVICWANTPARFHRKIVSKRLGSVDWPCPGHPLDGRSGHHGPPGWLIAVGDHIQPGTDLGSAHVFDLNATIHELVGVPRPASALGSAIAALRQV
jgi:predicted AlkP superfamily phosphohydrolase/phosphomutase